MSAEKAKNTVETYASAWSAFEQWCAMAQRCPMPADSDTCVLFATWCLSEKNLKLATVRVRISAVNYFHRKYGFAAPAKEPVREFLKNARRYCIEEPAGKLPVTTSQLRQMMQLKTRRPYDVRNRAIILVLFAAGWRRSELSALNLSDVAFAEQGMTLRLKKSKTDQQGRGRLTGIQFGRRRMTCPVRALKEWLAIRGQWQGPLFCAIEQSGKMRRGRLCDETICSIIKKALDAIGENSERYGAHSLRAGMVTTAIEDGASESLIMQRTGHRSYASLKPYIRPAKAFFGNPLAKAL